MAKQKVVIVGGGFGGVMAALKLSQHSQFEVSLISDQANFRYYPTLYHAATGGKLAASSIPLAEIFKGHKVKLIRDTIKSIDRQAKFVKGAKRHDYDQLILALGVITNYFGIKGLAEYSFGIKNIEEAHRLRDHIHKQLVDEGRPDLNYVVIGGGPTGVELAAALPHYVEHIMRAHHLSGHKINVDLVEAAPRLMPRMPLHYSRAVAKRLRRLGIKLYLNETVLAETADQLEFSGGQLKSHTVVWTAGVTNHPFFSENQFALNPRGKVVVDDFLAAEDDIYVIGDNADTPFSGMAQTAQHDAKTVAANLVRLSRKQLPKPYKPSQPAYATPVGPGWAALLWGRIHTYGRLGWLLRSAADFVAYHDIEPVWQAGEHWLANAGEEKTCLVCAGQTQA
jgi:NADH:ubiquinone reductase (H+-translocating)